MLAPRQLAPIAGCTLWLADIGESATARAGSILSSDELARAERFVFEKHRQRFVAARLALRQVLSMHVGRSPSCLDFAYGPQGKPELVDFPDCHFNMSHSGRYALVAIGKDAAIGVDIEIDRPVDDVDHMALECFDEGERSALARLAPEARSRSFLRGWTRKEAVLKAVGTGFSTQGYPSTGIGSQPRLIEIPGTPHAMAQQASLHSFDLVDIGAMASVACLLPTAGRQDQLHDAQTPLSLP